MVGGGTLLMLGAGTDQLPAYHEARRRGYRLVAVDRRADAPGAALADRFLPLSTRDTEAVAAALAGEELAGVVTTASDAALATHRELALRYGLPAPPSARAVRASMDKTFFRQAVAECGLATYPWVAGRDRTELIEAAKELPLPVVVKPADASGGKGISLVTGYEQLSGAIDEAMALSAAGLVCVEQYVDGRHYAVEIWMRDGDAHFVPVTEKRMTPLPAMVTTGHLIPARLSVAELDEVRQLLVRICRALEITDGPANFDFVRATTGELYLIEVGARLGGNAYPRLMAEAWGVDTVGATVSRAVGRPFDLTPTRSRVCLLHLLGSPLPGPGVLRGVSGIEEIREHPGVRVLDLFTRRGEPVRPFTEAGYKLGYLVLVADTHDALDALLAWCSATLRVDVEPV